MKPLPERDIARENRVESLVRFLCSTPCAGRSPGSPQGVAARERIVQEFTDAGLIPLGSDGFVTEVPDCGANVLGVVPGHGPLAERSIMVAAHYDHLGVCDDGGAYWGADDNAAAVSIMIEVARSVSQARRSGRQVIFAAFDGEEPPHFMKDTMGSMHYVANPPVPHESMDMMICMDLVGHALGPATLPAQVRNTLFVLGAELSNGTPTVVDEVASNFEAVVARRLHLDVVPPLSDYYAFRRAGVPVLFLTCGRWQHYHQTTDTPDRLDYPKISATAAFLDALVGALCIRPGTHTLQPDGTDDLATVATLRDLGRALVPGLPEVQPFVERVETFHEEAKARALTLGERDELTTMVEGLETILA